MGPEERDLVRVLKKLNGIGGAWYRTPRSRFTPSGMPDIIGCLRGWFLAAEIKRFKGSKSYGITPVQQARLNRLQVEGAGVALINSEESLNAFLDVLQRFKDANP